MVICEMSSTTAILIVLLAGGMFVLGFCFGYDIQFHLKLWKYWDETFKERRKKE